MTDLIQSVLIVILGVQALRLSIQLKNLKETK